MTIKNVQNKMNSREPETWDKSPVLITPWLKGRLMVSVSPGESFLAEKSTLAVSAL
jgi:hypothetical protein